ncbi:CxxC motif-containing protein [Lachnospiraceae bacterium XBB1006]|nr:CxxC motif-containing protein [Lachnospiraceae bacterium XBB1006]
MSEKVLTCIGCPLGCTITVTMHDGKIESISGNTCKRGEVYARTEVTAPVRTVTSTVKVAGGILPVVSVKTAGDIPKEGIFPCMEELRKITVTAPVNTGDVIVENVCDTGVSVIATKNVEET